MLRRQAERVITGLAGLAGIGLLTGVRHAFEPDHLAAVTTLATRNGSLRRAAWLGALWGVGHGASIGGLVLLLAVSGLRLPAGATIVAELLVALLLVGLGTGVLRRVPRRTGVEPPPSPLPVAASGDAVRSFCFGLAHGLAGSGAVIAIIVTAAAGNGGRLAWAAAFGTGTGFGMIAASLAAAGASRFADAAGSGWMRRVHIGAACCSILAGLWLAAETIATL